MKRLHLCLYAISRNEKFALVLSAIYMCKYEMFTLELRINSKHEEFALVLCAISGNENLH